MTLRCIAISRAVLLSLEGRGMGESVINMDCRASLAMTVATNVK